MPIDTVTVEMPGPVDQIIIGTPGPQGPSGGGSPMGVAGVVDYRMLTSLRSENTDGTELHPLTWEAIPSGTYGPYTPANSAGKPSMEIITAGDNSTMRFVDDGFYQSRLSWVLNFPNSAPTIIGAYQWGGWMSTSSRSYHPVSPARVTGPPFYKADDRRFANPHSADQQTSPVFWAYGAADDYLSVRLWWNTVDDAPANVELSLTIVRFFHLGDD